MTAASIIVAILSGLCALAGVVLIAIGLIIGMQGAPSKIVGFYLLWALGCLAASGGLGWVAWL